MRKLLYIVSLLVVACKSSNQKLELVGSNTETPKTKQVIVDSFIPLIQPYLPDTTFNPTTNIEFREGMKPFYLRFYNFIKVHFNNHDTLTEMQQRNKILAHRLLDDYQQYISFKLAKNATDKSKVVSILGFCSPYSKLVSIEERKKLFLSFPEHVQNSVAGKKVWLTLQEYSFMNVGKSIREVSVSMGMDKNRKLVNVMEKLSTNGNKLIMFGASWCGPCIVDELSLLSKVKKQELKGITIVGLSVDSDFSKWATYIKNNSIPWDTYVLKDDINNSLIKFLGFQGVPRCLLIDELGTIMKEHTSYAGVIE